MNALGKLTLAGVLLCYACGDSTAGDKPTEAKPPPLSCTIRCDPICEQGKAPTVKVEIANWTDEEIYLVGSLDGSDWKWRYPLCYFEVTGPDGQSAVKSPGRCGNMNPLREKDFVKVPNGGKFNPFQKVDGYGFFSAHQISPDTFKEMGEYRIRFIYSTNQASIKTWLGDGKADDKLVNLLEKVPKTTVSSNEIRVRVVKPQE